MNIEEMLDYLDGRGIIFVDDKLVEVALEEVGYCLEDEVSRTFDFDMRSEEE